MSRPLVGVLDLVTSVGGVQTVMAQLLPRLGGEFRVVVLDPYRNPDYRRMCDAAGIERQDIVGAPARTCIGGGSGVRRGLRMLRQAPWLLAAGLGLRRWVAARGPAVVYSNQRRAAEWFGRFVPRGRAKLVYHCHGFDSGGMRRAAPGFARRLDRVICVSSAVAAGAAGAGFAASRIVRVCNGVDAGAVRRAAAGPGAALPPRGDGDVVVVQVGVLAPHKQQHLAVEALALLPAGVKLWLCGDVPAGGDPRYREQLRESVAQRGLGERVVFLGWREDAAAVMAAADILVLPSRYESFGLVLAEAMALEKPCVGTRVGGIPEVIEDGVTGIVVEAAAQGLADALGRLAADPALRRALGRAGRERVEREFSLDAQAAGVTRVLHEVIGREGGS